MCCRLSPWNKVICYSLVALIIGSLVLLLGGAFAVAEDENPGCSLALSGFEGSGDSLQDPLVPLSGKNAYNWWLANAGIFCMIMVVMSFICCCSYVTLCCGFKFHYSIKIAGFIGFILLIIGFLLYVAWLAVGSYLIGLFGPRAALQRVCHGVVAYVVLMYIYLFIFIAAVLASILFSLFGGKDDDSKRARDSAKSKPPKLPPTKMLTMMV